MKRGSVVLAASVIVILIILAILSRFLVDLLWFDALGFRAVFTTVWGTEIAVFFIVAILSCLILLLNGVIAAKTRPSGTRRPRNFRVVGRGSEGVPEVIELSLENLPWRLIVPVVALVVGVMIGFAQAGNWDTVLKWLYAAPFGRSDPLFGHDLGFYLFALPFYELLRDWGQLIIFLSAALAAGIYWVRGDLGYEQPGLPTLSSVAIRHLSILIAAFFLVKSGAYILQRFDLMTSNNGIVFGAAYTDVHVRLPLLTALAAASAVGGLLCAGIPACVCRLPRSSSFLRSL